MIFHNLYEKEYYDAALEMVDQWNDLSVDKKVILSRDFPEFYTSILTKTANLQRDLVK